MEHSCYKCGQPVEQGAPFCRNCSAPQIRVVVPEPELSSAAAETPLQRQSGPDAVDRGVRWPMAMQASLIPALIAAVGIVSGLIAFPVALLGAGFLSVVLYMRRVPGIAIRAGLGAAVGALSGLISFGVTAVTAALRVALLHEGGEIQKALHDMVEQTAVRFPEPQYQPGLDFWRTPDGMIVLMIFLLLAFLVFFLILGSLGGALSGAVLGRRKRG